VLALEPKLCGFFWAKKGGRTLLQEKATINKEKNKATTQISERVNVWDGCKCIFYEENSTPQSIQRQPQQKEDGRSDKKKEQSGTSNFAWKLCWV